VLTCFPPQGFCSGLFELKMQEFLNKKGVQGNRNCCRGGPASPFQQQQCECRTFFRICLKHYQPNASPDPPCNYGGAVDARAGLQLLPGAGRPPGELLHQPGDLHADHRGLSHRLHRGPFHRCPPARVTHAADAGEAPLSRLSAPPCRQPGAPHQHHGGAEAPGGGGGLEPGPARRRPHRAALLLPLRVRRALLRRRLLGLLPAPGRRLRPLHLRGARRDRVRRRVEGPVLHGAHLPAGLRRGTRLLRETRRVQVQGGLQGPLLRRVHPLPRLPARDLPAALAVAHCQEGWGGLFCNQGEQEPPRELRQVARASRCRRSCFSRISMCVCVCPDLNYCTHHKPCMNGATCSNTGQGSYTCSCRPGFTGASCEVQVNECAGNPCRNGGSCTVSARRSGVRLGASASGEITWVLSAPPQDLENTYTCTCPHGFYGNNCELSAMTCADGPCSNGGRCVDNPEGGYFCQCPRGHAGFNCEKKIDHCSSGPCSNGARCVDLVNSYLCQCPDGFTGMNCDHAGDQCSAYPCQNGGTCQEGPDGYSCTCPPGYTGRNCSSPINRCEHNPCHNGATCHERNNRYVCACAPGYGGRNCQFLLPEHAAVRGSEVPWMAVGSGVALVLLLLAGVRRAAQQGSPADAAGEAETINNLTNNCHRGDRDPAVGVALTPGVKNINKKMDLCAGDPDEGSSPGRSGCKSRQPPAEYNLAQEVKQEAAAKEALLAAEDQRHSLDSFQVQEQPPSASSGSDAPERKSPEPSACADTKYKSVFVMSEEKDECIIATEV
ncbi:unnamed protein product, partial [Tetraodon nigroviridis]